MAEYEADPFRDGGSKDPHTKRFHKMWNKPRGKMNRSTLGKVIGWTFVAVIAILVLRGLIVGPP